MSKCTILPEKRRFFTKKADISKIKRALARKGIFAETVYECALMSQVTRHVVFREILIKFDVRVLL